MAYERDDTRGEIDLARYGRRLAARWWIVALCVAVAVVVALLRQESGAAPDVSEARAFVSIGQPLSPNGVPIAGTLNANPLYPGLLLSQPGVRDEAAREAGLRPGSLAGRVSIQAAGASAARAGTSQQVYVTVRGPFTPEQAGDAANALAQRLVASTSGYQRTKVEQLTESIAGLEDQVEALAQDSARLRSRIRAVETQTGLAPVERLTLLTSMGQTLAGNRNAEGDLREQLFNRRQLLEATRQVEQSQVVDPAEGRRVSTATGGSGVVVAAVLGLVVGVLLALLSTLVRPLRRG